MLLNDVHFRLRSLGEVWAGLLEVRSGDPCSLVWSSDCRKASWVDFGDANDLKAAATNCVALNETLGFRKEMCTKLLPFVCQVNIGKSH